MDPPSHHVEQDLPPGLAPRRTVFRAADLIVELLVRNGVDVIFGIPGGCVGPILDALVDCPEIRVITARHESGAMFAAAAYARATGKLGVVLVTSGPGVLNTVTGLASAKCDGVPVLVLSGEVPRTYFGRGALQEGSSSHLNVVGMARHVAKLAIEVTEPNVLLATVQRAVDTALSGRKGPVLLSLPLDVSTADVSRPGVAADVRVECHVEDGLLRRVASTLWHAKRPVLFVGSGTRWDDGPARLRALAERLQCPVMTTPKGKGIFPESHPLSLGVFGHGGHPSSREFLEGGVDVLLAVGTGMTDPATDGWSNLLVPRDHLIQIDADGLQIGRAYPVSLGLVGGAARLLERLVDHLPHTARPPATFGVRHHEDPGGIGDGPEGRILPHRALWELQRVLPANTLYSCDIGEHMLWATHYLFVDDPHGFLVMTGLASMGSGVAGAVGLKLAFPNRPVASVVGDGCFAMAPGDVSTAVRERIPLVIAVLNDQRYGMVEEGQKAIYGRTMSFSCGELDIVRLAEGMGAEARVIRHAGELLAQELRPEDGPLVLDVQIDRTVGMPRNQRFNDMSRIVCRAADR